MYTKSKRLLEEIVNLLQIIKQWIHWLALLCLTCRRLDSNTYLTSEHMEKWRAWLIGLLIRRLRLTNKVFPSRARARVRFYEKQCQSADVDRLEAKSIIILAFVHNLIRSLVGVVFSIDILMNFMLLLLSRWIRKWISFWKKSSFVKWFHRIWQIFLRFCLSFDFL